MYAIRSYYGEETDNPCFDPWNPNLRLRTANRVLLFLSDFAAPTPAALYAAAFKPNAAFFEVFGAEGWTALKEVIKAIRNNFV